MPSPTKYTRLTAARSVTGANPWLRSPPRGNQISSAMSQPIANGDHTTPKQTQQPTRTTSVTQPVPTDTSPGARSSRQSNEINESGEQLDAANSEGHVEQGEGQTGLVPGKQNFQALLSLLHIYTCYCYMNTFLLLFANCSGPKASLQENHWSWLREAGKKRKQDAYSSC